MSAATAAKHLIDSIIEAPLEESPFPHCYIRDVLPTDYYALIQGFLPEPGLLISNGQAGRGAQLKDRFVLELKSQYLNTLPDDGRLFWTDFAGWILNSQFRQCLLNKFSKIIELRFKDSVDVEFTSDAVLVQDRTRHNMGPHTDHPRKAVSMLLYLPKDRSQPHLGTSIYIPKDPAFLCPGGPHHQFDKFDRLATFPFLPNSLFIFAKTNNSFHGVEPIEDSDCRRWLLMVNVIARHLVT